MEVTTLSIDAEDIEDILVKIERSFDIKFEINEFKDAETFDNFLSIILSKMKLENTNDCTAQQAFYKLRKAILEDNKISIEITPRTELSDIFPRETRKQAIKKLEKKLGIKLDILTPKMLIIRLLILFLIVSFIGLFIQPNLGVAGIVLSIVLFEIAYKLGIEFSLNSVGELVNKMIKTHYNKSRKHPLTANLEEIKGLVSTIFEENLGLNKGELTTDTRFDFS